MKCFFPILDIGHLCLFTFCQGASEKEQKHNVIFRLVSQCVTVLKKRWNQHILFGICIAGEKWHATHNKPQLQCLSASMLYFQNFQSVKWQGSLENTFHSLIFTSGRNQAFSEYCQKSPFPCNLPGPAPIYFSAPGRIRRAVGVHQGSRPPGKLKDTENMREGKNGNGKLARKEGN